MIKEGGGGVFICVLFIVNNISIGHVLMRDWTICHPAIYLVSHILLAQRGIYAGGDTHNI